MTPIRWYLCKVTSILTWNYSWIWWRIISHKDCIWWWSIRECLCRWYPSIVALRIRRISWRRGLIPTTRRWCVRWWSIIVEVTLSHASCPQHCLSKINRTAGFEVQLEFRFADPIAIRLSTNFAFDVIWSECWLLYVHLWNVSHEWPVSKWFSLSNAYIAEGDKRKAKRLERITLMFRIEDHAMCR